MRKLLIISLIVVIGFVSCKKDETTKLEPKQEQNALAINYTATWCGYCGSEGAPIIKNWGAMDNVVAITAHASQDPMNNNLFNSFSQDRTTGGGIPSFWVGDNKTRETSAIENLLTQIPVAAVAINHSVSNNQMEVSTKTVFYEAGEGSYYLSILVLEDGIDGSANAGAYKQNGTSDPNYTHAFVLRASSIENKAYGELLVENPQANEMVEKKYNIPLNTEWKNIYPVAIIWKYDATSSPKYQFINAVK